MRTLLESVGKKRTNEKLNEEKIND